MKVETEWESDRKSSILIACHFTPDISTRPGGLRERLVTNSTMEETRRGVQTPAKGETLVATLIPCAPTRFETCKIPRIIVVETAGISTLAGVDTPVGIGGIAVTSAWDFLGAKGLKVGFPLRPTVTHSYFFPLASLVTIALVGGLT